MRVLVTGADGFVGRRLVPRLLAAGHHVLAACRPGGPPLAEWLGAGVSGVATVPLELADDASVQAVAAHAVDAVVHLAALSSGAEARRHPAAAWEANAVGTARLLYALGERRLAGDADPVVLVISTAEVYGAGPARPRREDDPVAPVSPYAASKVGAETAALETWRRTGLRAIVVRPFQHTGPGQSPTFVVPAWAARLRDAARRGERTIATGNLTPVRDLLDVRDVVDAYVALLERGVPGEIYNVASGIGVPLSELFERLARLAGVAAVAVPDPALVRSADIPHLVGDPGKLRAATGWKPCFTLDDTLRGVVDAQAD
ncbi:MAG TPA: NAD-dependent epimerase/dehydratase family protein [Gemmatimonadales bacterium]|nr:NAD-dependent epimerase/dehydratase family protein [Gemmatimonadales bacterium]